MNKKLAFGVLAFVVLIINEVFNDAALAAEVSRYGAGLLALILGSTGAVEQFSGD